MDQSSKGDFAVRGVDTPKISGMHRAAKKILLDTKGAGLESVRMGEGKRVIR